MKLADRVREALAHMEDLEEKKMFGGLCFMVNGKLCIGAKDEEVMFRIGPEEYPVALEKPGCRKNILLRWKSRVAGLCGIVVEKWQDMCL